jgi:hypothetical protein
LNDPTYLRAHFSNLTGLYRDNDSATVVLASNELPTATGANSSSTLTGTTAGPFSNTESILGSGSSSASLPGGTDEISKSMYGLDIDISQIYDSALIKIVNYLNYLFEPVHHTFTLDVMSNHIQNLSVLLFILSAIILIFFISLLFNVTLFIFSDRLLTFFTNKYIV